LAAARCFGQRERGGGVELGFLFSFADLPHYRITEKLVQKSEEEKLEAEEF
jgi:hypothetical protein